MNDTPIKTYSYRGFTINVYADGYVENPRNEEETLGTLYWANDKNVIGGDQDVELKSGDNVNDYIKPEDITLPVYMLDHSGQSVSTSPFGCPWDSGMVGYISVSREDALKYFNRKRMTNRLYEMVEDVLRSEIRTLDDYITGRVYYYETVSEGGEVIDSCSGMYGDPEGWLADVYAIVNHHLKVNKN